MTKNSKKNFLKKWVVALLSVCMVFAMMPTFAYAADPEENPVLNISTDGPVYLREDSGNLQYSRNDADWRDYTGTCTITGSSTTNTIIVKSGSHTIKLKDVSIDISETFDSCAFDIQTGAGDVTVLLEGTNALNSGNSRAGIEKNSTADKKLTITSADGDSNTSGSLYASSLNGAGIGGGVGTKDGGSGSNIIISGGSVVAESSSGAGIGGGVGGFNGGDCSDITISGGSVTASSINGAGIGGGSGENINGGNGSNITISGGSVTASSINGAGIGGGESFNGNGGDGSDITINGGTVFATSTDGAGIGGGRGKSNGGSGSNITISGGTVDARSESGAGIGGGFGENENGGSGSDIIISGGSVTASSINGAGIGGGFGRIANGTQSNNSINATSACKANAYKGADKDNTTQFLSDSTTTYTIQDEDIDKYMKIVMEATGPTPPPTYHITDGAKGTWTKGSDAALTFKGDGAFEDFVSVKVDGKVIDKGKYTAATGSTVITLKTSYLDTLTVGKHTFEMVWKDGSASTTFTVQRTAATEEATSPETGDTANISIWLTLMMLSAGSLVLIFFDRKKKKYYD